MAKRRECVEILLKRGANVNHVTYKLQMTPLHWAAYQADPMLVQLLLDNGAEQNPNRYEMTPVDMAGYSGNTECVRTFCKWLEN